MKNLNNLLLLVAIIFGATVFNSCTNEEKIKEDSDLLVKLIDIENSIALKHFNTTTYSREIKNAPFFDKISEIKSIDDQQTRDEILAELTRYDLSTSKFSGQTIKKGSTTLTSQETLIYQSLFNSLKKSDESSVAITDYYINEISCLEIDSEVKNSLSDKISFYKDLLIFYNFDVSETNQTDEGTDSKGQNAIARKWKCPYRDCLDCCMNSKLEDLSEANIVEWCLAIAGFPEDLVWIVAACGWDCIFDNY